MDSICILVESGMEDRFQAKHQFEFRSKSLIRVRDNPFYLEIL